MKKILKRGMLFLICITLLVLTTLPVYAAEDVIDFLSYEEALTHFDFTNAASNWCLNFGQEGEAALEAARQAIIAGTSRDFIVRLATYARDVGYGDETLIVTNAFRPASYQEVIGLYEANGNIGPYRNALSWNGHRVVDFWWNAESQPGWPEEYTIDLSGYDIPSLDPDIFYRTALRLWDNSWANAYYARPGCSAHNSGCAIDIMNYWLGTSFAVNYQHNGKNYAMADYGLYKPLQPTDVTAGEAWHITCDPDTVALGNYDVAFNADYEIVFSLYFNPGLRGWQMTDGRGLYLGAGVTVIQLRLCQLGLLEEKYITGYYCSKTEEVIRAYQEQNGLKADGICGAGTLALLFPEEALPEDSIAPTLAYGEITAPTAKGFTLCLRGEDDQAVNAYRVETRQEGKSVWVSRVYNAGVNGRAALDVDIWEGGIYAVRAAAIDRAGNESPMTDIGTVLVDTEAPVLREVRIQNITGNGFDLTLSGRDNGQLAGFTLYLTSESGETREKFLISDGHAPSLWTVDDLTDEVWEITVTAVDSCGNESSHEFTWKYDPAADQSGHDIRYYGA